MHKSNRSLPRKMDERVNSWSLRQWLQQRLGQASHLHTVTSFQQTGIVWLEQHLGKCHFKAALLHAFELCCDIPFTLSVHLPIIQIMLGSGNSRHSSDSCTVFMENAHFEWVQMRLYDHSDTRGSWYADRYMFLVQF